MVVWTDAVAFNHFCLSGNEENDFIQITALIDAADNLRVCGEKEFPPNGTYGLPFPLYAGINLQEQLYGKYHFYIIQKFFQAE